MGSAHLGLEQGERLVDQLLSLIQALVGQAGVVRAFGVLNIDEVPVELTRAVEGTDGVQLFLGVGAAGNSIGELVGQGLQLVPMAMVRSSALAWIPPTKPARSAWQATQEAAMVSFSTGLTQVWLV